jgi:hypothetical protein
VLAKYRVLSAMLSFEEFTLDDLSRFSGVKITTVRTILDRHRNRLQPLGAVETGKRGGRLLRYRLTKSGSATTREELAELYESIVASGIRGNEPASDAALLPLGLRTADDTVNRLVPAASSDQERLALLEIAENEAQSALHELPTDPGRVEEIRRGIDEMVHSVQAQRQQIHAQRDEKILRDTLKVTKPSRLGFLVNLGSLFANRVEPHMRSRPKLQLWTAHASVAALSSRIAMNLEPNADVIVAAQPSYGYSNALHGDLVILVVDSGEANARAMFLQSVVICRGASMRLFVFDSGYDAVFRNSVLEHAEGYCPDVGSLSSLAIIKVITPHVGAARRNVFGKFTSIGAPPTPEFNVIMKPATVEVEPRPTPKEDMIDLRKR